MATIGPFQETLDPDLYDWFTVHKKAGCPKRHMCDLGLRMLKDESDKIAGRPVREEDARKLAADLREFLQMSKRVQFLPRNRRAYHEAGQARVQEKQMENLLS